MTWITLVDFILAGAGQLLEAVNRPGLEKVAGEVKAAIDALNRARTAALTEASYEALRTPPQW